MVYREEAMPKKEERRFFRQFSMIERRAPRPLARFLQFLRRPWARVIRIPLGLVFVVGGVFSFLPVLGIWMLPLGLLLLAVDLPLLRPPVAHSIIRVRRWYENWQRRRRR